MSHENNNNNTPTLNVPNRPFKKESRKMISMRLPESMVQELKRISAERGWTVTDVVQTALERFIESSQTDHQKAA